MVFWGNLLFSTFYSYAFFEKVRNRKITSAALLTALFPMFCVWLLICGGQYQVGTDYESYMDLFCGKGLLFYEEKGEYGFVYVVKLCNWIGLRGQALFFVFYTINFLFYFLILKRLKNARFYFFILLYITVASLFNNQLNGLRQATAVYIGTYGVILFFEKHRFRSIIFILGAISIHMSSIMFLLIVLSAKYIIRIHLNMLLVVLLVSFYFSLIINRDVLNYFVSYLPVTYSRYIESGKIEESAILLRITKYLFIPLYLLSIIVYRKLKLTLVDDMLFRLGIIAYSLRILVVNLTIAARVFDTLLLFSIFPLFYYLSYSKQNSMNIGKVLIILFLFTFYFIKTMLFASGEYFYKSIYF